MGKTRGNRKQPRYQQEPTPSKAAKATASPDVKKQAHFGGDPEQYRSLCPVWKVSLFDADGPWGRDLLNEKAIWDEIYPKLRDYEALTWKEIESNHRYNHSVTVNRLIRKARKRLEDLSLDIEELFRLRLGGTLRLWGIRENNAFKVLWWDPHHEICPSKKKHT